jgi:hypothetical protein
MSRPKKPAPDVVLDLRRRVEELEAEVLVHVTNVKFLNDENIELLGRIRELKAQAEGVEKRLQEAKVFALKVLEIAEQRKEAEKTVGVDNLVSEELMKLELEQPGD